MSRRKVIRLKVRLDPVKEIKRFAREHLGMPPPTRIHRNKKKYSRKENKRLVRKAWEELD